MKRLTETNKWDDPFFMALPPLAKLVIGYFHDRCDECGFIDSNYDLWQTQLKMGKMDIKDSLLSLKPLLISDNSKKKIFIKHFLFLQGKLPLHQVNVDHAHIIEKLKRNLPGFNNSKEIQDILNNIVVPDQSKQKSKKRDPSANRPLVRDNPPTIEEWAEEYQKQCPEATEGEITSHYGNCRAKGWTIGKNKIPMVDWKAAITTGVGNLKKDADQKAFGQKKSRTQTTINLANQL